MGARILEQSWPAVAVPTASVLVRAYNHERFLAECLESILAQVVDFPVEIIVHDDASTDGTAAIVRAYAGRYPNIVRPVLQAQNQFSLQKKCLPLLHGLARGAYIAMCDGDDAWRDAQKLRRQVEFLAANPAYVLSFHDAVHVDEEGRVVQAANLIDRNRRDYSRGELRVMKWGWMLLGTIVHRHVKLAFPPEFDLAPNGDHFLPMLLAASGGAKFQAEAGPLAYRQHRGGLWSGRTLAERAAMHLQTSLQIAAYFVRIGEADSAKAIIGDRLAYFAREYFRETSASP